MLPGHQRDPARPVTNFSQVYVTRPNVLAEGGQVAKLHLGRGPVRMPSVAEDARPQRSVSLQGPSCWILRVSAGFQRN